MEKYTDQEFFYKQTPVNYDGIAKFTSIKGNTLGWNQLVKNGNFASTDNWTNEYVTATVSNNVISVTGTRNGNNYIMQNYQGGGLGHKYYFRCDYYTPEAQDNVLIAIYTGSTSDRTNFTPTEYGKWLTYQAVINNDASATAQYQIRLQSRKNGITNQFRNCMLIDLTQMYGSGNEPTADKFLSLFSLPYYEYNQGTLIPFSGNGIKTTGKNQFKASTVEENKGLAWATGVTFNENGSWASDYIPVIDSSYKFNKRITQILGYDGNKNYIGAWNGSGWQTSSVASALDSFSASGISYIRFALRLTTILPSEVQLEIGTESTNYEPYQESTTSLPISTYFPTGMKSAGSVYDELADSKVITRVGEVDLGSLDWQQLSAQYPNIFRAEVIGIYNRISGAENNAVCGKYESENVWLPTALSDKKFMIRGDISNVYIHDSTYSDVTTFKQAMADQNVKLYYELATETETDAEDIFYKFYADGTEQLLPVNGSTPSTSYLIADIEYYDSTEGDSLYRRFWLINGDGERWDLTDKEFKSFLNNPTGLGFRKTIEVTRYGEKANKNNEVYDFPQPSGELLFYDTYNSTRYDKYNKFIRFLMSQPITLYYMIPVSYISGIANIFTLDCDVTEVQKTESKTDRILTSSIVFNGLGFYEGDEISINGTTNTYTLTNEGDFPVGFEITIEGSNMETPYITLSQDGELYGEAKFEGSEGTGYGGITFTHVYLNSNDGEQNLELKDQSSALLPNPLNYQDLSISNGAIYVTFIKLAKGVSELSIGMESGSLSSVNIKYSPKYRSV